MLPNDDPRRHALLHKLQQLRAVEATGALGEGEAVADAELRFEEEGRADAAQLCRRTAPERMSSSASPAETAGTTASVSDAPPSTMPEKPTSAPSQASGGAAASTGVATRRAAR